MYHLATVHSIADRHTV